jgi:hypothetical protein
LFLAPLVVLTFFHNHPRLVLHSSPLTHYRRFFIFHRVPSLSYW